MIEPEPTEQPPKPERKPSPTEVATMIADQLGEKLEGASLVEVDEAEEEEEEPRAGHFNKG